MEGHRQRVSHAGHLRAVGQHDLSAAQGCPGHAEPAGLLPEGVVPEDLLPEGVSHEDFLPQGVSHPTYYRISRQNLLDGGFCLLCLGQGGGCAEAPCHEYEQ